MLSIVLLHHEPTTQYGTLSLNYKSISILDYIPDKFISIERLYLNHNKLKSLMGIQSFKNLKLLHIRFNNISDFEQLNRISNPFFMESIAIIGNPLEFDKRCKEDKVREIFKNLKQYNPSYRDQDIKIQPKYKKDPENNPQHKFQKPKHVQFHLNHQKAQNKQAQIQQSTYSLEKTPTKVKKLCIKNTYQEGAIDSFNYTKRFASFQNQSTKRDSESPPLRPSVSSKNAPSVPSFLSPLKPQYSITARFKPQYSLDQKSELTIDLIDSQNSYLAEAFHLRSLIEKSFNALKQFRYKKANKLYNARLKLKGFASLKASVTMRRIQREYAVKRKFIIKTIQSTEV